VSLWLSARKKDLINFMEILLKIADKRWRIPWERRSPYRLFQETHHIFQMTGMRNSLPVRRPAFPEFAAPPAGKYLWIKKDLIYGRI